MSAAEHTTQYGGSLLVRLPEGARQGDDGVAGGQRGGAVHGPRHWGGGGHGGRGISDV